MNALYVAFTITWVTILIYVLYLIRTRVNLRRELKRLKKHQ
ncbi:MAG: CcmD family protein [Methanohalobium sp.]